MRMLRLQALKGINARRRVPLAAALLHVGRRLQLFPQHTPGRQNPQPSTLNPDPSTLNPQSSILNPQHSTLNP